MNGLLEQLCSIAYIRGRQEILQRALVSSLLRGRFGIPARAENARLVPGGAALCVAHGILSKPW